jgi:predicted Zn-dependent peptidase
VFRSRVLVFASALLICPVAAAGEPAPEVPVPTPSAKAGHAVELEVEKYQLENGLEVLLHRDGSQPFVAVNIWYRVGPGNEPKGRSGFAHLFEHLMFEGSRYAGTDFDRLLETAGATNVNGTTSWDRTNYYETVPREHLELVLWLESDRMGFMPSVLTEERLALQKQVVQNERRQSYENAPYGPTQLALLNGLFPEGHPYHGAVIGSMKDIAAATMKDVREFFDKFYAPANATLALAGDFDPRTAKQWIERYFGSLPARGGPRARPKPAPAPSLGKPDRIVVDEPVELGQVTMGWLTPPAYTKDDAILQVVATLLGDGKTSRLYRKLMLDMRLASEVAAWVDSNRLASSFVVRAVAASGKKLDALEAGLESVLSELERRGPSIEELERAKRKIVLALLSDLQLLNSASGESGRAGALQRLNHYLDDPGKLKDWVRAIEAVTAADVARTVRDHLRGGARLTVITEPRGSRS